MNPLNGRLVLNLAVIMASLSLARAAAAAASPVELVDPMIGSGVGSCMPGPCLPHASIYPSPETTLPQPSGYRPGQPIIGFAQLHTQGTGGLPSYGNFLVSPQTGVEIDEAKHASPTENEHATATRYDVRLSRYGVDCGVVPSRHGALYQFRFGASRDSTVLIDVARKIGEYARDVDPARVPHRAALALVDGRVTVDPRIGTITGGGTFDGNWVPGQYRLFFAAQFDRPAEAGGVWKGAAVMPGVTTQAAGREPLGGYLRFTTTADRPVRMRIAVSFRSVEQAQAWLREEVPDWNLDGLQAKAKAAWYEKLGRVTFGATDADQQRTLYTALWHAMVQPRDRTGDNGEGPFWDDHYTLWDSWKTLFPLMNLVDPHMVGDVVNSFAARHRRNADGYVGTAFVAGIEYRTGQGGDEVDNVIADAFAKGAPGVDWPRAYDVLTCHADGSGRTAAYRSLGYVPVGPTAPYCRRFHSGSGTLAFAQNDFSAALVAKGLGHDADAARWRARAGNWRNVWDDSATDAGFVGFPRSRLASGPFAHDPLRKDYNVDFYEATSWEACFQPVFDLDALVDRMGGRQRCLDRLTYALRNGLIDFGNEPSFMTIWIPAALDRPDLTAEWAAKYRDLYRGHALPGDDDQGAMSSMYLFLCAGLYPIAGQDVYYLHGPSVPEVAFHLDNGRTFTITADHAGPANIYVQSVSLDGVPLAHPMIRHGDILRGGTLHFVMGPTPPTDRPRQ